MSEFSAELYATALRLPPEFWLVSANDEQPSKNDLSAGGKSSKGNAFATGGDNRVSSTDHAGNADSVMPHREDQATEEGASKHLEPDKPSDPSDPQR